MDCTTKIENVVSKLRWVKSAKVNFPASLLKVLPYEDSKDNDLMESEIGREMAKIGFKIDNDEKLSVIFKTESKINNKERERIKTELAILDGVNKIDVIAPNLVKTEFISKKITKLDIRRELELIGLKVSEDDIIKSKSTLLKEKKLFIFTLISLVFICIGVFFNFTNTNFKLFGYVEMSTLSYIIAMVIGLSFIGQRSLEALIHFRMDINTLMSIAVIGSGFIGEWLEGATVIFLFLLAQLLEICTLDKARNAVKCLIEFSPKEALVKEEGGLESLISVDDISVDDLIVIKPGERIPLDGIIVKGQSSVNQATITGESMPVNKTPGDEVYAGTINEAGSMEIKVSHLSKESTLANIIHLIEEAQSQKAPFQNFVDRFAKYYTPIVIAAAILIALVPPFIFNVPFAIWFYRALVLLVISCPCSLVISTPVSLIAGITRAARKGILFKGGASLEQIGNLNAIAFDKTGTLTNGNPTVTRIISVNSQEENEILRLAASVESRSEHSIGRALVKEAKHKGLHLSEGDMFESVTGRGASMAIDNVRYYVGSTNYFEELSVNNLDEVENLLVGLHKNRNSVILFGSNEIIIGIIVLSEEVRKMSRQTIKDLYNSGIQKIIMLTGDHRGTASAICKRVGLDEFKADLSPAEKVEAITKLIEEYNSVGMIGDGINDSPALTTATVGIAMGASGTDITLESSDVVIMGNDLSVIPFAIKLGKQTVKVIKQNIFISILIKVVFLSLAVPGFATLWMAVGADMGASLIVIINGLRLLNSNKDVRKENVV